MSGQTVAVIGGGAWGTALATVLCRGKKSVRLWARDPETIRSINESSTNPKYLPDIRLSDGIVAEGDMQKAVDGCDLILLVIPAQKLRGVLDEFGAFFPASAPVVLCAKGIERSSGLLMSDLAHQKLPECTIAALSGPSFATDVARGLPTAVTVAAADADIAHQLAESISVPGFRCYSTSDIAGVEIGGALKNVLAIAAGAVDGAGLGASAIAAMITRGFVELRRIGSIMGAQPETMMGLSGLGDLVLTCSSSQSRNYSYGLALGRGESIDGLPLAEGAATAAVAAELAAKGKVEAPIINATARLIDGRITVEDAVRELFARPLKREHA